MNFFYTTALFKIQRCRLLEVCNPKLIHIVYALYSLQRDTINYQ